MTGTPPYIAAMADVRRLGERPYAEFMPHRRVLEALEDVARREPDRTALTAIDVPNPEVDARGFRYVPLGWTIDTGACF